MEFLPYVLSGVASLLIGAFFYHPKVLGTMWMKAAGMTEEDVQGGNMAVIFGLAFVMAMIIAAFMSYLMEGHPAGHEGVFGPIGHGAFHGLIVSLMTAMPIITTIALFERKGFKYIFVNVLYWMINFAVIGGIVEAF